jgi:hypothetical protein
MSVITTPTIQLATLTLTDAQVRSLASSPQTLVAAPGANKIIIPLTVSCSLQYVASFTGGGSKIIIQMTSSNKLWQTALLDTAQTANEFASGMLGWVGNYNPTSNYANQAITVTAGANYTGGTGSSLVVTCLYYVLDA